MRRGAQPGKAKVEAKPPIARKSPKDGGAKVRDLEKRLAEALKLQAEAQEQQRATSEILRVISSSPGDLRPVFDTILANAARLCEAHRGALLLIKDGAFETAAELGTPVSLSEAGKTPYRPDPRSHSLLSRVFFERRTVYKPDLVADRAYEERDPRAVAAVEAGSRSMLAVPLLREDALIGVITIHRPEPGPFSDEHISLLKTFADQAVIAIENVRLFTELQASNRDLTDSLEQQTATAEILRVISSSPTDVQPVFDAVAESAARLCDADVEIFQRQEDGLHRIAHHGPIPSLVHTVPVLRETFNGRAVLEGRTFHVADLQSETDQFPLGSEFARQNHSRAQLSVPLMREGSAIGTIGLRRLEAQLFTDRQVALLQTFADQAVIAIENVRLFTELREKNEALTLAHAQVSETLEQQTATAEILRVISSSPTDVQPVFDVIVERAVHLCGARFGRVYRFDDGVIHLVAGHGLSPVGVGELQRIFPRPAGDDTIVGRVILSRQTAFVRDIERDEGVPALSRRMIEALGTRSQITIPMLRAGEPIGAMTLGWAEPEAFDQQQIALVKTFADQAVIAIENVRLFTELGARNAELTETLARQTATGEVLRAISGAPTDAQPVFDIIAASVLRLCNADHSGVTLYDGELIRLVAQNTSRPEGAEAIQRAYPLRPAGETAVSRAIRTRVVVQIPDVLEDQAYELRSQAQAIGFRSYLAAPMLREGEPIGTIGVGRTEPGPFSDSEIELLKTFADQAVIAIENVRLFTELQASNRDLTSALDTQTATSDILRVISQSRTNVQPVFDAIVASAVRLLGAYSGGLTRVVGDQLELAALTSTDAAGDASLRALFPHSLSSEVPQAQAIRDRAPLNMADAHTDPRISEAGRASARVRGVRGWVVVPMLLHDQAIGTIGVTRREAGGFTDDEIALLKTFADQAVIAIENARLLSELQQKNEALTQAHAQVSEALEQQTATAEILEVMSQSQTDAQPVFEAIVRSALRLCNGFFSIVYRYDGEMMSVAADHQVDPRASAALRALYPAPARHDHIVGRALLDRRRQHIADVATDPEIGGNRNAFMITFPYRTALAVPMLREGVPIGAIAVGRSEVRPFTERQIEVLETFADQAVIAIENVRLFKELQARTGELTRSVEQLTALGEVSQALSSTLDVETVLNTIVSRASQLAGADACGIYEYDEAAQMFHVRATHNFDAAFVARLRAMPLHKGEGAIGRATEAHEPIQIPDIEAPGAYESRIRDLLIGAGYRALLSVPLLREEQIIGSLSLTRKAPGEYSPEVIEVLKTFATQSALAIQNARLFREIADKSRQLEVASQHKSEFLANMSHELRTPLNAIIGYSEMLQEEAQDQQQDAFIPDLGKINAAAKHLLELITDILDLSKIEAGRMELEPTDFYLPSAIDNAVILVRERAVRRGITLQATIDPRLGDVRADERKIKQVVLNLLSNAIKFTPEGGRIDVGAVPVDGSVEVSVTDTGVGIAPEDQEAVFEEFRQVGTADKKVEGTGLGLTLCRKFVELHGGRIWVTSAVSVGSTFTFTLPVRREE